MRYITLLSLIIIVLFSGCIGDNVKYNNTSTPTLTPTPIITYTQTPTISPTQPTPSPTLSQRTPIKYKVWVDSYKGFFKVRAIKNGSYLDLPQGFNVRNFSIKVGDTVRWVHDDDENVDLTILNNASLWDNNSSVARLRYIGRAFEYTFNKTGSYKISIKEYKKPKPQIITVKPE